MQNTGIQKRCPIISNLKKLKKNQFHHNLAK